MATLSGTLRNSRIPLFLWPLVSLGTCKTQRIPGEESTNVKVFDLCPSSSPVHFSMPGQRHTTVQKPKQPSKRQNATARSLPSEGTAGYDGIDRSSNNRWSDQCLFLFKRCKVSSPLCSVHLYASCFRPDFLSASEADSFSI